MYIAHHIKVDITPLKTRYHAFYIYILQKKYPLYSKNI